MRQIHLLQLYIRQPGHRRRHTCALSLHWSGLRESTNITKTAIVLVGDVIAHRHYEKSRLYAPDFFDRVSQGFSRVKG